ncbi:MAG: FxsA family protein [Solirubrobacteraceae bacterium]
MFFLIVFVALIGIPLLEIFVVIEVSRTIGLAATLALMILDAAIGTMLMRSQGRAVWASARRSLSQGRAPAREVLDGALVIVGGALLIAPGFITDLFGALLLAPPTRAPIRRLVVNRLSGRMKGPAKSSRRDHTSGWRTERVAHYDADTQAVEVDPRELER